MKYKVVYFTRTGTSKRVAEKISKRLSCEIIKISDNINWSGIVGFIKGGFYSSTNKKVKIKTSKELGSFDELIVVSPLWAGGLAPAIKAFLESVSLVNIHLVITSDGSIYKKNTGTKTVTNIVKSENNEDEIIGGLINKLKKDNK